MEQTDLLRVIRFSHRSSRVTRVIFGAQHDTVTRFDETVSFGYGWCRRARKVFALSLDLFSRRR